MPESKSKILGPLGETHTVDPTWEHATVVRRNDGSYFVNAGFERKKHMTKYKDKETSDLPTQHKDHIRGR